MGLIKCVTCTAIWGTTCHSQSYSALQRTIVRRPRTNTPPPVISSLAGLFCHFFQLRNCQTNGGIIYICSVTIEINIFARKSY